MHNPAIDALTSSNHLNQAGLDSSRVHFVVNNLLLAGRRIQHQRQEDGLFNHFPISRDPDVILAEPPFSVIVSRFPLALGLGILGLKLVLSHALDDEAILGV